MLQSVYTKYVKMEMIENYVIFTTFKLAHEDQTRELTTLRTSTGYC